VFLYINMHSNSYRLSELIKTILRPQESDLGPKVPYLSVIGTLIYLANYT